MMYTMIQTVLYRKVNIGLHKKIKYNSVLIDVPTYMLYNIAMKDFSSKMKKENFPVHYTHESAGAYKDVRVEKVDSEVYKSFRISCIQKDISISQGINLALTSWLENQNDANNLELRT